MTCSREATRQNWHADVHHLQGIIDTQMAVATKCSVPQVHMFVALHVLQGVGSRALVEILWYTYSNTYMIEEWYLIEERYIAEE